METLEAIYTRRSIRKFSAEPVKETDLEKILKAAMCAPSANHETPWHFIVVKDRKLLEEIPKISRWAQMASQAALAIIVCGDRNLETGKGYWPLDCSAATQNILLAAHSLGYGAVWTAVYPDDEKIGLVSKLFNIPKNVIPLCIVPIGRPDQKPAAAERYDESRVHADRW